MRLRLLAGAAAAVVTGLVGAVLVGPTAAEAHVTVNPSQATQGGFTKLAFRVPNESDTASTTKVEVSVPTQTPIASVSIKPVSGWTAVVETSKLDTPVKIGEQEVTEVVSKIIWTANGPDTAIKAGQFQEFEVSVGPLPQADQIVFKALQTYSDGTIVRWIEETEDGQTPEYPAPVLKLAAASASGGAPSTSSANTNTNNAAASGDARVGWALALGIVGLLAGLAGLTVAVLGWRRMASRSA